jgi:hypothetical protein
MTIKQQGGIFGRNPTYNDVTVDGSVSVDTISEKTSGSGVTIDGFQAIDGGAVAFANSPKIDLSSANANGYNYRLQSSNTGFFTLSQQDGSVLTGDGTLLRYNTSGYFDIYQNLAFANGKGIDFSATAGTGTSELFDDYEEGTWTPNLARFTGGSITATYSNQVGYYTKVGNLVTLTCYVTISSISSQGSGYAYINGLPFSPIRSNDAVGIVSANTGFATVEIRTCIASSNSRLYFRTAVNGADFASPSFLAGGEISLTLQYMTS